MSAATSVGPHGLLVVDKPRGPTSFRIVSQARRLFGTKTVGHAGTLDPMATGVLLVLVGEATKLSGYLTAASKSYLATVTFGESTDSFDADGTVTEQRTLSPDWLCAEKLEAVIESERTRSSQRPPAFSAVKVAGRPAYSLARSGAPPDLAARAVSVGSLSVLASSPGELTLEMRVSKGYYVRSLVRDLCAGLGVPGHLSQLRRTASGGFLIEEAHEWLVDAEPLELMPLAQAARRGLPSAELRPESVLLARHGKALSADDFLESPPPAGSFAWVEGERLIAIGEAAEDAFRVLRGFNV